MWYHFDGLLPIASERFFINIDNTLHTQIALGSPHESFLSRVDSDLAFTRAKSSKIELFHLMALL